MSDVGNLVWTFGYIGNRDSFFLIETWLVLMMWTVFHRNKLFINKWRVVMWVVVLLLLHFWWTLFLVDKILDCKARFISVLLWSGSWFRAILRTWIDRRKLLLVFRNFEIVFFTFPLLSSHSLLRSYGYFPTPLCFLCWCVLGVHWFWSWNTGTIAVASLFHWSLLLKHFSLHWFWTIHVLRSLIGAANPHSCIV